MISARCFLAALSRRNLPQHARWLSVLGKSRCPLQHFQSISLNRWSERNASSASDESRLVKSSTDPVLVKTQADIARVAGAIAARIRDHDEAVIRSVGREAGYRAVLAVITAGDYINYDDPDAESILIGISPKVTHWDREEELQDPGPTRRVLELVARIAPKDLPQVSKENSLLVSGQTNAGKLAGAISHRARRSEAAVMRVMGASATNKGLIAAHFAQRNLDGSSDSTKGGEAVPGAHLVVVPWFNEENQPPPGKDNTGWKQLCLTCIRADELAK